MSPHVLRPAIRDRVHLMLALAGPSGSGKTYSALRLAVGLAGGGRIAFMDTETGRAKMYVPTFSFDHMDLEPPYTPDNYLDGIKVCAESKAPVIVIDSMSHEWNGEGGLSDWHDDLVEERVQRTLKNNRNADEWQLYEVFNVPSWREPKLAHKRMMQRLLGVRAHLIFCLRAEEKIRYTKVFNEERKREETKIVPAGWVPICEKNFMYEMTASFLLSPDAPGVPKAIKLQAQHAPFFDLGQPITERSGELLARWAAGGAAGEPPKGGREQARPESTGPPLAPPAQEKVAPGATSLFAPGAPDPPSYKVDDAVAMVAKMHGGRARGVDLEAAFAPGARTPSALALYAKNHWDDYRQAFDTLHREFLVWKDQH